MKKELFLRYAANVAAVISFISIFAFVAGLFASNIVWTPGTPSPLAQSFIMAAAVAFCLSLVSAVLWSELGTAADDAARAARRASLKKNNNQ